MTKSNSARLNIILSVCCVVLVLVIVAMAMAMDRANEGDVSGGSVGDNVNFDTPQKIKLPELTVGAIEERGDVVVVTTSYCTLKYPFAFVDLMKIEPIVQDVGAGLDFSLEVEGRKSKVFTLLFGSKEGALVGRIKLDGQAEAIDVTVVFYEVDAELNPSLHTTFYAVQETFNDIVNSLCENTNFIVEK